MGDPEQIVRVLPSTYVVPLLSSTDCMIYPDIGRPLDDKIDQQSLVYDVILTPESSLVQVKQYGLLLPQDAQHLLMLPKFARPRAVNPVAACTMSPSQNPGLK